MSRRVLAGLVVGLVLGLIAHATRLPALLALVTVAEPVGTLWINAILSTVIPLVVSSLIVGIASSSDTRFVGRLGRRAAVWFFVFAACSAVIAALLAPLLLAWLPLDAATSASLRASAATAAVSSAPVPTVREWLIGLVPSNAIKAATDGAMLPLVIFTLAFALALTRVEASSRESVVRFFEGVSAAMRVLVGWVLALAPVGVFALTFALAARLGISAAGALAYYVVLAVSLSVVLMLVLYPATMLAARVSLLRFARAAAPAQAVAFGSRSSLASLPALLHGAERALGVPTAVAGFALPLAVATFKFSGPAAILVGVLFTGRLYDISFGPLALAQATVMALVLSFAVPGVPGGWLLIAAPIFAAMGVPVQAIGMLLAVDAIPDMFRTPVNVTADLAVTAILGRETTTE
ncbi:MAG: dicarboxylate/amino acid:cation symporter [Gemmatimonadaceae bacterium]|nr:dicarboxylate/amino acid:cation symporter [Gemmatimonadaceae bacterium]